MNIGDEMGRRMEEENGSMMGEEEKE